MTSAPTPQRRRPNASPTGTAMKDYEQQYARSQRRSHPDDNINMSIEDNNFHPSSPQSPSKAPLTTTPKTSSKPTDLHRAAAALDYAAVVTLLRRQHADAVVEWLPASSRRAASATSAPPSKASARASKWRRFQQGSDGDGEGRRSTASSSSSSHVPHRKTPLLDALDADVDATDGRRTAALRGVVQALVNAGGDVDFENPRTRRTPLVVRFLFVFHATFHSFSFRSNSPIRYTIATLLIL
jgi:hypothetical protein